MADDAPRRYRALVLCPMRKCAACAREVFVRNDRCEECGARVPRPQPRVPRPRRPPQAIPATGFGLTQAAAAMNLDTAAMPSIN
jgi:hypothetical protein